MDSIEPAPGVALAMFAQQVPQERPAISLAPTDSFPHRHIGPTPQDQRQMLDLLGYDSLDALSDAAVPEAIRLREAMRLPPPRGESELLEEIGELAKENVVVRSFIGQGYYETLTPGVIVRNILENPGWYTQYTPYQAEISQGRLEALLNFQTMVSDLTGLPLANASLLDEATAAAEAMAMCRSIQERSPRPRGAFFAADHCHPQTLAVLRTRAKWMGIELVVGDVATADLSGPTWMGVLVQYPTTDGKIVDFTDFSRRVHESGALLVVAADLLALTLLKAPGEFGTDIAIGSAQRFGVPFGFGGPHAAYMSTRTEYARKMPGRLVGVSRDVHGNPAYRLAIQTREQHIRREKATSNICTAQVLLAIMAGMYAVYHGPDGLRRIARRVHALTVALAAGLRRIGHDAGAEPFFDTVRVRLNGLDPDSVVANALARGYNLRRYDDGSLGISLDEATTVRDVEQVLESFSGGATFRLNVDELAGVPAKSIETRTSAFLTHPVFSSYHSETEMLRYIKRLESRDLSLAQSMIPLGSCTMKLNATTEMIPVTNPGFARIHPMSPPEQWKGYAKLFAQLESWLAAITGFDAVSLQPNAGSQGEYAGLLAIRRYHEATARAQRTICLIPESAHGTNPASAVVAGLTVVAVKVDSQGRIDMQDLAAKAAVHSANLACVMVTYPSTRGVFEEGIAALCELIHRHGGQVYLDGANLNAQVGLCRPGDYGADVCHLNLHKTFCIPHGGGGPGVGPIAAKSHLAPFLPPTRLDQSDGWVSAAPYGSAGILPIPWAYIALMGSAGLRRASQVAILSANYMAGRLGEHYPVTYTGRSGLVAHEFVMDVGAFDATAGVKAEDIAKRLMDYGFHAPTMSWPVPGTLMVEPTESESKAELDRFCEAMIAIREEIRAIESGQADRSNNVLKNAPHTAEAVSAEPWDHPYPRQQAAYPLAWVRQSKFWPFVGRIDNPYGDRNLVCSCPPMERAD